MCIGFENFIVTLLWFNQLSGRFQTNFHIQIRNFASSTKEFLHIEAINNLEKQRLTIIDTTPYAY